MCCRTPVAAKGAVSDDYQRIFKIASLFVWRKEMSFLWWRSVCFPSKRESVYWNKISRSDETGGIEKEGAPMTAQQERWAGMMLKAKLHFIGDQVRCYQCGYFAPYESDDDSTGECWRFPKHEFIERPKAHSCAEGVHPWRKHIHIGYGITCRNSVNFFSLKACQSTAWIPSHHRVVNVIII